MKNINLSNFKSYRIDGLSNCEAFYTDRDYVLVYSDGRIVKCEERDDELTVREICNLTDTLFSSNDEIPKALEISYSFEKNSIFAFLSNGDIISVEFGGSGTCSCDTVGSVEGGLRAAKWSPENEVIALVTGNDNVIIMTNDFYPVSEVCLHGGGFGEKQFTTVGWGKKETQFRGSEGKYKAQEKDKLPDSKVDDPGLDDSVRISWRGDAELFAVSCINPETGDRYLRIFSKEGILQYTSEPVSGLEHSLSWRPSGNVMASTQRLPNKYNVCFFEKNGLKHGEFTLPYKHDEVIVKELMWNEDSKLLALLVESIPADEKKTCSNTQEKSILLYSVNNYHWYCKYKIPFNRDDAVSMKWDSQNNNLLHVIVKKGNSVFHNKYTWTWLVHKSKGNSSANEAFVAVIDGSKLLLTSFRQGILPPPMCSYSLEMDHQINQVGFAPSNNDNSDPSPNDFFVQLSNGSIYLYSLEGNQEKPKQFIHKLLGTFSLDSQKDFAYNFNWVSKRTFAFCAVNCDAVSKPFLGIVDELDFESGTHSERKHPIKSSIALITSLSDSLIFFHNNAGDTYWFNRHGEEFSMLHPEQKRNLIELDAVEAKDKPFITFGLDKSNRLFVDDKIVGIHVTSFHVHDEFLLVTNLKHKLLCIPIDAEPGKITAGNEIDEVSTRRIERGSGLVTSISKGTKVILQMPRGNLECIQPRPLSLSIIGKLLDSTQYFEAFDIMRQQRINLNLLYDHNPTLFQNNVNHFIQQIKDQAWISLFLSELTDEDVTQTIYNVIYKNKKKDAVAENKESKIRLVCELLENELENMKNSDLYLLPILTTYLKRGEVRYIEKALTKIKSLKEAENKGEKLAVTFDEAFRYVLYLIDVEELYKVALGMYDFDLVLLVVSKSQKDPKEYLPFLNEIKKLEFNYQRFVIDKYLKRYEKALMHLLNCGDDYLSECLAFIKSHKLHGAALKIVPRTSDGYKHVCADYADELLRSNAYEEAGIMLERAGSYAKAIEAFRKSGNWTEVVSCSLKLRLSPQESNELYLNLAGELVDAKRFAEASVVYADYVKDAELAVVTLCLGKMFAEAFRLAEHRSRGDLVQSRIKPGILECYNSTKAQLSSFRELFTNGKKRLLVVREKKLRARENDGVFDAGSEQDAASESSTTVTQSHAGSRTTNRTFRSAKNRRKQERKLLSLKEGSPHEDLALIASLHNVVSNCYGMRLEVKELNASLIKVNEEGLAEELQQILERILREIEGSKGEIWTPELLTGRQGYGPEATSNSIAASFVQSEAIAATSLINPRLLIPPEGGNVRWKLEILKS